MIPHLKRNPKEITTKSNEAISRDVKQLSYRKDEVLEELTKQVVKGAGITFFGDIFGKGINFASQIIIARLLGAQLFGLYALGLVVFNVAQTLSRMGLSQGALRYVSIYSGVGDKEKVKGTIIQALGFSFIMGLIIGLILFFSAGAIANIFGKPELTVVIKILSFGIPFMASMMVAIEAIRGFRKMQYFVYVKNIFHPIVNITLVILLYWLGLRLLGAVSAWVIASGAGLVLSIYFIKKEFPAFSKVKASFNTKELIKFSTPLVLVAFLQMLFFRTDILMLGYFCPSADVGVYNAATQTVILLSIPLMAFTSIFSPIVADLYNKQNISELNNLLKIVAKWTFLLTLPVFIVVALSSKDILSIFGLSFSEGWKALLILAIFNFLSVSMGPITQTLIMSGKQMIEFYNTLGGFVLNIILNLLLIPKFGIVGAALATGISIFCFHMVRLLEGQYLLKLWPLSKRYLKGLIVGIITMGTVIILKSWIPNVNYIFSLLLTAILVITIFVGVLLLIGLDQEDKLILKAVKKKLKELPYEHKLFN